MEMNDIIKNNEIIGIVSNYELKTNLTGLIKDINIKNINNALKMVLLDDSYLEKNINDLTLNELFKIDLMSKLKNDIIVIGNLSKVLNYKDIEYFKKLFLKLNQDFNKKIIIIDNDIKVFFNCVKKIVVIRNKEIIYKTDNFFDENLYLYTKCPKIIDFINYLGSKNIPIIKTVEIHELIKDIFRSVS